MQRLCIPLATRTVVLRFRGMHTSFLEPEQIRYVQTTHVQTCYTNNEIRIGGLQRIHHLCIAMGRENNNWQLHNSFASHSRCTALVPVTIVQLHIQSASRDLCFSLAHRNINAKGSQPRTGSLHKHTVPLGQPLGLMLVGYQICYMCCI